jgi:transposase
MSLQPQPVYPIPDETRRVAHAAFPKGALCLRLVEVLGQLYLDEQFAALFPTRGQPAASPARLALVLVLQYGVLVSRPGESHPEPLAGRVENWRAHGRWP